MEKKNKKKKLKIVLIVLAVIIIIILIISLLLGGHIAYTKSYVDHKTNHCEDSEFMNLYKDKKVLYQKSECHAISSCEGKYKKSKNKYIIDFDKCEDMECTKDGNKLKCSNGQTYQFQYLFYLGIFE